MRTSRAAPGAVLAEHQKTRHRMFKCSGCGVPCEGQVQLCDDCRHKRTLCRVCGEPHGGPPHTTKFCPTCRAKRRAKPRHPHNPPWTEAEDAMIRKAYAEHNAHTVGPALRALFPTRPGWSLKRRAQHIGACTVRRAQAPWTEAEAAIVQECAWMTPERIAARLRSRGFTRSITAITIRINRTRLKSQIDGYNARGLARLLDVDGHKVVRWIEAGMLHADRAGNAADEHDRWYMTTAAVRDFLLAHPEEYELTKIERAGNKGWFMDLVTFGRTQDDAGVRANDDAAPAASSTSAASAPAAVSPGRGLDALFATAMERTVLLAGEPLTLRALAEISGRNVDTLLHRLDVLKMSAEDAAFGMAEPAAVTPAPAVVDPVKAGLMDGLGVLLRKHKVKPADLARWVSAPVGLVEQVIRGDLPLVAPLLLRIVESLDGECALTITPKKRAYED